MYIIHGEMLVFVWLVKLLLLIKKIFRMYKWTYNFAEKKFLYNKNLDEKLRVSRS